MIQPNTTVIVQNTTGHDKDIANGTQCLVLEVKGKLAYVKPDNYLGPGRWLYLADLTVPSEA